MKQLEEGLFEMDQQGTPCGPGGIAFRRYELTGSVIGDSEMEEAAARLLVHSLATGRWVGASWPFLLRQIRKDLDLHIASQNAVGSNTTARWRAKHELARYTRTSSWTLGLSTLFMKRPAEATMIEVPEIPFFSHVVRGSWGIRMISDGFTRLQNAGYVSIERIGEGDDAIDIVYPTGDLISAVMRTHLILN